MFLEFDVIFLQVLVFLIKTLIVFLPILWLSLDGWWANTVAAALASNGTAFRCTHIEMTQNELSLMVMTLDVSILRLEFKRLK